MNLESKFFKYEISDNIAHFILARSEKANSMSADFWDDLPRMVRELEAAE